MLPYNKMSRVDGQRREDAAREGMRIKDLDYGARGEEEEEKKKWRPLRLSALEMISQRLKYDQCSSWRHKCNVARKKHDNQTRCCGGG